MRPTELDGPAREFLSCHRIAVAGVSRKSGEAANLIYRKLRERGYEVFALNPRTKEVEGDACYPNLTAVPGGVEALVIATPPEAALALVEDCVASGVGCVWMHRSFGQGSVSEEARALCKAQGIRVIAGGCPMMYCAPVDVGHRCLRWFLGVTGKLSEAAALLMLLPLIGAGP